eukprot:3663968-Rhodomonas_salina.1
MQKIKDAFLSRFEGTDEGEVHTYLGCELVRYRQTRTITFRQAVHAKKVLQIYGTWDNAPVKKPLEAGVRLSDADSPEIVDPSPGVVHLAAAERVLQFLRGTYEDGLVYSDPGPSQGQRNVLSGWVDSDYASDPDSRKSVTGYVLSMYSAPISWKAKRQDCVTLSSAESEYVAASMCGQEVVYLRALLRCFGYEQMAPTVVWEDNA